eukprot:7875027-Pyramimonas_sp.AAC.2
MAGASPAERGVRESCRWGDTTADFAPPVADFAPPVADFTPLVAEFPPGVAPHVYAGGRVGTEHL